MALWQPTNADLTTQYAGMIVRTGAVPGEVVLAQADSSPHSDRIVGLRQSDVLASASGSVGSFNEPGARIRMDAPPSVNDVVYLSAATPGVGTTTAPTIAISLGICYEVENVGGVDYAVVVPSVAPSAAPSPGGASIPAVINFNGSSTNDSSTPLVAGSLSIDPSIYPAGSVWRFQSVGNVAQAGSSGTVVLYNVTDDVEVATLTVVATAPTLYTAVLTVGTDLPNSPKIYGVRLQMIAPQPTDLLVIGSATITVGAT